MKNFIVGMLIATCFFTACKSVQVAVPSSLRDNSEKYHVKHTGVSVIGHKIKINGFGEAQMHNGFSVKYDKYKRWFPWYFDLDKRLNYISSKLPNIINVSNTKYRIDFESNGIYVNSYCAIHATENSVNIKPLNLALNLGEDYSFEGLIFTNKDSLPWKLSFSSSKTYKNGFGDYIKNVGQSSGTLTNDTAIIAVNLVNISTRKEGEVSRKIPFKIAAGYEFRMNDTVLAFVDILDRNIWVSKSLDHYTRAIVVSAATSILVKTNAS